MSTLPTPRAPLAPCTACIFMQGLIGILCSLGNLRTIVTTIEAVKRATQAEPSIKASSTNTSFTLCGSMRESVWFGLLLPFQEGAPHLPQLL